MERTEFSEAENFEPPKKKKNKDKDNKNQRRFSDEQIKLLETMFESETRLEPKKKVQLARELGLQPRQVAIWFQNRRARWKSKQIEQDFRALRAEYDSLVSKFETLKEEKQSLVLQLQKLGDLVRNTHGENCKDGGSSSKTGNPKSEIAKPSLQEGFSEERGGVFAQLSDSTANNDGEDLRQQGHEEDELVVVNTSQEVGDASIVSLESWYRHDHQGSVFDQPRGCSQWLNFWS